MKGLVTLMLLFLGIQQGKAQTNHNAKITDFSVLKAQPLIAVIKDPSTLELEKLKSKLKKTKSKKKQAKLKESIAYEEKKIKKFNEAWTTAVKKYWELNNEILFKTYTEVAQLKEKGALEYTVLLIDDFSFTTSSSSGSGIQSYGNDVIFYTSIDNMTKRKKVDYFFVLQNIFSEYTSYKSEETYKLNFKLMQQHIVAVEKKDDTKYVFYDHAKESKQQNCVKLKGNKVLIYKETLYKMARKNPNKSFYNGAVRSSGKEAVANAILNDEDVIIGVPFLSHFRSSGAGFYYKILVNTKTYEIISCTNRANAINEFLRVDLKSVSSCK